MMTAEHTAIVKAYEQGMLPDDIAEDRDLDVVAVKAALMQCSTVYRKDCKLEPENEDRLNFNKDEQERVKDMMLALALGAESEKVRANMCQFIRDDAKGRRDTAKLLAGNGSNVFIINQHLAKVREAADRVKSMVNVTSSSPVRQLQHANA